MEKIERKIKVDVDINKEVCKGCKLCVSACPKGLIEMVGNGKTNKKGFPYAEVKETYGCTLCTECALMCPDVAIEISYDECC